MKKNVIVDFVDKENDIMITYRNYGRFGNILHYVYTTYWYCYYHNISFENIIFGDRGFSLNSDCTYFIDNRLIDFFKNIKFINHKQYLEIIKDYEYVYFKRISNKKMENVVFTGYGWAGLNSKIAKKIFGKIIYNFDLFKSVKDTVEYNLNDYTALHIRRGDFKKYRSNVFQTLEKIEERLQTINTKCIVFSDDIEWCKENLKNNNLFYLSNKYTCWQEWIIMTLCKNVSISPTSTFSSTALSMNEYLKDNNLII